MSQVGYICVGDVSEGQEIKLHVIALSMRSSKGESK